MATRTGGHAATGARRPAFPATSPILISKITTPGVPDWAVPRPRVGALIGEGTRWCPLTVVTGPPGAGKTMALASWAAGTPGPVAWVSLEEHDNRPAAFWSYVVAALRRGGVTVPRAVLAAARSRPEHAFLLQLAVALAGEDPPVTLILDDFHDITEPRVLAGLDFLLRSTGSGLRLVVASRMDPPLRLHRYRLAGELAEIRSGDLAFSTAEAGQLLAQHGNALSPESLERLTQRTEGWAAGLRLAAISMDGHPDPDQFVKELVVEDSALTGYLVEEVLNAQTPEAREVLLSTSILEHVHPDAASELTGNEKAAAVLLDAASTNAFIQPLGSGWYRYHGVFADVLRLKLRLKEPDRVPDLHRRAAWWYERHDRLTEAVRHAAQADDWQLAAGMVVDGLAIGEIGQQRSDPPLDREFACMPAGHAWSRSEPHLILAAEALSAGHLESAVAALDAADGILGRLPAAKDAEARLTAALLRLSAARRTGDLAEAAAAVTVAEEVLNSIAGDKLARHPEIRAEVLCGRGAVALWSDEPGQTASVLGAEAAATAPEREGAGFLGLLALTEAVRGELDRADELAAGATAVTAGEPAGPPQWPDAAALVAAAWVRLERNELREAHDLLKRADAVLAADPDRLIAAVACLLVAWCAVAEGRADVARQFAAKARDGWSGPAWLDHMLSQAESRAAVVAGDIPAALAAAGPCQGDRAASAVAAVTRAYAWAAAGNDDKAIAALAPVLAAHGETGERVRIQARLVEARLSYRGGDRARGHRSFASALRLAERQQIRLPFVLERDWVARVVRGDADLAATYYRLLGLAPPLDQLPGSARGQAEAPVLVVEPLTEREREVLRHASTMLNTAEIATVMYISTNTVKTHLKSAYRKLAVGHRGEAVRRARQLQLI